MIIRIWTQGQFSVSEEVLGELNDIDVRLETAVRDHDQTTFEIALKQIHEFVTTRGTPVEGDLVPSDLSLPDPDATIQEVEELLNEDGLIPG